MGDALDLSFLGGEPLLEWDLLRRCVEWMEEQDVSALPGPVHFSVTINGVLFSPDRLDWMAKRDFLVGLSVDGSPAMHNIDRRFPDDSGSHTAVARALELLCNRPNPPL